MVPQPGDFMTQPHKYLPPRMLEDYNTYMRRLEIVPARPFHKKYGATTAMRVMATTDSFTHVETPSNALEHGKFIHDFPIDQWVAKACLMDFSHKEANSKISAEEMEKQWVEGCDGLIMRTDFAKKRGLTSGLAGATELDEMENPKLTREAMDWIIKKKIKLYAEDFPCAPREIGGKSYLFKADVCHVIDVTNLDQIKEKVVTLVAAPLKFRKTSGSAWHADKCVGVDSSMTRAIAIEGLDISKMRILDLSLEIEPHPSDYMEQPEKYQVPHRMEDFCTYMQRLEVVPVTPYHAKFTGRCFRLMANQHSFTHVECAFNNVEGGKALHEFPIEHYVAKACVMDFSHKEANTKISAEEMEKQWVEGCDGLIMRTRFAERRGRTSGLFGATGADEVESPKFTQEALDWILAKKIKLYYEDFQCGGKGYLWKKGGDICHVMDTTNLDKITKKVVTVIGLPLKITNTSVGVGIGATMTRAIAFEEK